MRTSILRRRTLILTVALASAGVAIALAQAPSASPPAVLGRDPNEGKQVIGKEYALRVRLINVAGAGVQQVRVIRVAPDGNVTLPRIGALKAEGIALAALEQQATAAYVKAIAPTASADISIADREPPAPPPPPPPPPAPPAPPATTQAATTQATTQAHSPATTTQSSTQPAPGP